MAGGPNTPELVAAVSRAGGLGVLGVTGTDHRRRRRGDAAAIELADGRAGRRQRASSPPRTAPTGDRERILAVLAPFRAELGLPPEPPPRAAGRHADGGARGERRRRRVA